MFITGNIWVSVGQNCTLVKKLHVNDSPVIMRALDHLLNFAFWVIFHALTFSKLIFQKVLSGTLSEDTAED